MKQRILTKNDLFKSYCKMLDIPFFWGKKKFNAAFRCDKDICDFFHLRSLGNGRFY